MESFAELSRPILKHKCFQAYHEQSSCIWKNSGIIYTENQSELTDTVQRWSVLTNLGILVLDEDVIEYFHMNLSFIWIPTTSPSHPFDVLNAKINLFPVPFVVCLEKELLYFSNARSQGGLQGRLCVYGISVRYTEQHCGRCTLVILKKELQKEGEIFTQTATHMTCSQCRRRFNPHVTVPAP